MYGKCDSCYNYKMLVCFDVSLDNMGSVREKHIHMYGLVSTIEISYYLYFIILHG